MLDLQEIELEIRKQEARGTNYATVERLACLYAVRNEHKKASFVIPEYSESAPPASKLGAYGDSDFLRAVSGKDASTIWPIMDELMDTLSTVCPKCYNHVMEKIARL